MSFDDFIGRINKHGLRFAVSNGSGKHSGTWVALGHKCNFYVGAHSVLGSMKISLHESGICRVALTEGRVRLLAAQGLECPADRAAIKWRRAPTPETGVALVMSLMFPTRYFQRPAPVVTPRKPTMVLDAQPEWEAAEVCFFFTHEPASSLESKIRRVGTPLPPCALDNGETVWIVARRGAFDLASLPTPEMLSRAAFRRYSRSLEDSLDKPILTAVIYSDPRDGEALRVTEIGGVALRRAN